MYTCSSGSDIRLNFLIKTASSSKIYLTPEQIVLQKPNSRIVYIDKDHKRNSLGIPFLVYCATSELKLDKTALKVCLYREVWHTISLEGKRPYLEHSAPAIHNYDTDENPLDEQSASFDEGDDTNLQIRNSPIQPVTQLTQESSKRKDISLTIPKQPKQTVATVKSTTSTKPPTQQSIQQITLQLANMTTTAQTTTATQVAPATTAAATAASTTPPATVQQITDAFNMGLKHVPGGGGSGAGGSGEGGAGGGAGPIGPANQMPVVCARDVKAMGTLPHTFTGDRTQAEQFMEEVRTYLRLNNDVAGFNSPIKQVYFTLSCMKGDDVAGWVRNVGEVVKQLDPINDNIPEVWNQFVVEFTNQYMDLAQEDQAQAKLETLKMKDGLIDEYIAKFIELCRQAGYILNSPNATRLFL